LNVGSVLSFLCDIWHFLESILIFGWIPRALCNLLLQWGWGTLFKETCQFCWKASQIRTSCFCKLYQLYRFNLCHFPWNSMLKQSLCLKLLSFYACMAKYLSAKSAYNIYVELCSSANDYRNLLNSMYKYKQVLKWWVICGIL